MSDTPTSRRLFLQSVAATGLLLPGLSACASAPALESLPRRAMGMPWPYWGELPATPPPPPKAGSVGVAVIGLGGYALGKAMPGLVAAEGTHVSAVVSGNPEKAAKVAAAYGLPQDAVYSYDNFASIAADDRVEAVYIVLPSGLHADWTEMAFAAGKHVICEKPMALTAGECERMITAANAAQKKLMIAYRCHFEPYNLHAMDLMREGAVGQILSIETANCYVAGRETPATNWRLVRALTGGGALEDFGLYGLQAALYLTGEEPIEVHGWTEQPKNDARFTEIPATTRAELRFPSGAVTKLVTSYNMPNANRVSVIGSAGTLLMDPATGYGGNRMYLTRGGATEELKPGDSDVQFARMPQHFADAIRKDTPILTPGEMGLRDTRIIEAIYASAEAGRPVAL
ncbi:MAG TPA: Gfo/Idh/MocA family oxidoreductase [Hyphomonas sp.]|nr:Gfo/Idh/MocA family oxidoreductase [Hyphomonas sp.]HRK67253.1 Gfo/Idh/MocA family oxidoreductase [Hyphomonas sp.]